MAHEPLLLHATTIAWDGRGLLILGPAGSGKSALALALMAHGAGLVADDRTLVTRDGETLLASCPSAISGMIEARGVGLLAAEPHPPVPLVLAADLSRAETERLPPERCVTLLDCSLPVVHDPGTGHFAAALLQYLKAGRRH